MSNENVLNLLKQLQDICIEIGCVANMEGVDITEPYALEKLPQNKKRQQLYTELLRAIDDWTN